MRIATFTVTRNEKVYLPIWVKNALRSFSPEDIYILDHQSSDGSVDFAASIGCNVETIYPPENPDAAWFLERIKEKQRELLKKYDWVLFAETDEFVLSSNSKTLREMAEEAHSAGYDTVRLSGLDVLQDYKTEPNLSFSPGENILENRSRCISYFPPGNLKIENAKTRMTYSKPNFSRSPTDWTRGFHWVKSGSERITMRDDLFLVHCHFLDVPEADRRHSVRRSSSNELKDGSILDSHDEMLARIDKMLEMSCEIPDQLRQIGIFA